MINILLKVKKLLSLTSFLKERTYLIFENFNLCFCSLFMESATYFTRFSLTSHCFLVKGLVFNHQMVDWLLDWGFGWGFMLYHIIVFILVCGKENDRSSENCVFTNDLLCWSHMSSVIHTSNCAGMRLPARSSLFLGNLHYRVVQIFRTLEETVIFQCCYSMSAGSRAL